MLCVVILILRPNMSVLEDAADIRAQVRGAAPDAFDPKRVLAVRFPSPTTPDHPADFGPTGVIATLTNRRFWTRPSSIDKALHSPSAPHTNFRLPIGKAPAKASLRMGSRSMSPLG